MHVDNFISIFIYKVTPSSFTCHLVKKTNQGPVLPNLFSVQFSSAPISSVQISSIQLHSFITILLNTIIMLV